MTPDDERPPQASTNAEDPPRQKCDFCLQEFSWQEPAPLTRLCDHGRAINTLTGLPAINRAFADVLHVSTLPDGRVLVQLDMPPQQLDGMSVCIILGADDAERFRVKMGSRGAALAQRWRV